ncbi:Zona pellucida sperm-binding protein 3 [Collichthys lucidus]|uniref:Interleukin-12 subunit alpha n=1 Tax=Collichthys lucidus TaxID=240159 RepID=A0A4U5UXJ2_COLLU|nr:Zona pellucida sperm-binding protein 3 [Collichthys lucidus]
MPLVKLYFSPALLLLVLTCPLWQVSQSLPVMSNGQLTDSCGLYAKTLLQNITATLKQNNLFSGIDCSKQSVELNTETNTASVCAPKKSCLTNIGEDLQHYYKLLAAQPDPDSLLGPSVLSSLRELMENCFAWSLPTDTASNEVAANRPSTYDERLSLCKVLKGFQIRTITINRVISYIKTHADIQPQLNSKQQQNEEFIAGPRPIVVNCYPDSMEVVVQADMFEKGLRVDGRHLRLGLDSAIEGSAYDWQFERGSYSYFLGDPIHFEIFALIRDHMPLRVYVDQCVATATPDAEATLRYNFIEHYGCLTDAYLTNSSSHFLPRVVEHRLRFQIDAFRFYQMLSNQVEEPLVTEPPKTTIGTKALPSMTPQESLVDNRHEHHPASYLRLRPGLHPSQHNKHQQSSAGLMKRGAEYKAEQTIQLGPITVLPPSKTDTRPSYSKTDNNSTAVTCCRQFVDSTYYNIAMVTRKLSGVLIMLLLFAVGYFVQRVLCSRSRQLTPPHIEHPTVTTSQEPLVECSALESSMDPAPADQLPSYEECKGLPTYEETVRDGSRGRAECSMGQT